MPTPGGPTSVMTVPRRGAGLPSVDAHGRAQLAHGQELDDAVLHVVEAVVVGVEHCARRGEVELVVGAGAPRQLEHPVEPGADPAVLGRLLARPLEPVDLLVDEVARPCRPGAVELVELRAVLADDVVVALAELLADGGQLLAQQELALLLVDALGDVGADLLGHLQLGQVVLGPVGDQLDALLDVDGLQHLRRGARRRPRSR